MLPWDRSKCCHCSLETIHIDSGLVWFLFRFFVRSPPPILSYCWTGTCKQCLRCSLKMWNLMGGGGGGGGHWDCCRHFTAVMDMVRMSFKYRKVPSKSRHTCLLRMKWRFLEWTHLRCSSAWACRHRFWPRSCKGNQRDGHRVAQMDGWRPLRRHLPFAVLPVEHVDGRCRQLVLAFNLQRWQRVSQLVGQWDGTWICIRRLRVPARWAALSAAAWRPPRSPVARKSWSVRREAASVSVAWSPAKWRWWPPRPSSPPLRSHPQTLSCSKQNDIIPWNGRFKTSSSPFVILCVETGQLQRRRDLPNETQKKTRFSSTTFVSITMVW